MRVLLVTDWNPGRGGAEMYVDWLRRSLPSAGADVRLLTGDAGTAGDGAADFVARCGRHPAARAFLQVANPFAAWAARRAVRSFRPDVVHVHLYQYQLSGAVLPALGDVPILATLHDYKNVCPLGTKLLPDGRACGEPMGVACHRGGCLGTAHWWRDRVRYACLGRWSRRIARRHVYSRTMFDAMAGLGVASDFLPLPVASPDEGCRRSPAAVPTFLYAGRLEREKGVEMLVPAFGAVRRAVPSSRLVLAGEGSLRGVLADAFLRHGLADAVEFTGWLEPRAVGEHMAAAWALVAPSAWAEPFGLVAPEAILRGVPVIASERGGLAESVEPGLTGLLFPNGDTAALGDRMLAVASGVAFPGRGCDPAGRERLRAKHDPGTHLERLCQAYRSLITDH